MSTINNLLDGASPYQVLQEQAGKLAGKWEKSGLLEGIDSSTDKNNMSMLLENQAKQLVNEQNSTTTAGAGASFQAGNSEAWAGVALPLVRRVFGEIVAKDLVSVQPMNLPAGLIFYLDFQYGKDGTSQDANESLYGATADLKRTDLANEKGLYGAGNFGYSNTASQTIDLTPVAANTGATETAANAISTGSAEFSGILNGDTEFSSSYAGKFGGAGDMVTVGNDTVFTLKVSQSAFADADFDSLRAWEVLSGSSGNPKLAGDNAFFPQYTRKVDGTAVGAQVVEFVVKRENSATGALEANNKYRIAYIKGPDNLNDRGDFEDTVTLDGVSNLSIPSINVQMRSDTVAAKTRKLKAQWTPEFAQDLNAYHSIDAEAELTSILSEYISMEIDLEILDMLIRNADTVEGWSASVAKDVSVSSNETAGGTSNVTFSSVQNDMGVYYTKMSWFQTLGVKLQKVSNLIHQKTLRGGANWMVISPKVSTILESIPGFAADSAGDDAKYNMGVQKIGAINSRYTVYKNPYMTENVILMGYKGSQFLETGAVFAPYIPLIMTPLVYDPVSFTPRKGIMTRYAKKMVRPDFYGKVYIQDLNEL
jgi:hypothetical protein